MNRQTYGSSGRNGRVPQVLIAEDDPDDRLLIRDALVDSGIGETAITFCEDGEALLETLHASPAQAGIVLLDLNMPRKDGREALREIKLSERLKHIPVIVFTTSSDREDIHLTYSLGGNTFFTKPSKYEELQDVVSVIKAYWLELAKLDTVVD